MKRLMTILLLCSLTACAAGYRPYSAMRGGGYRDQKIDATTYRVSFEGNGFTTQDRVDRFLMLRCAEVTIENGAAYFVVLSAADQTRSGAFIQPGVSQTVQTSRYTSTTTTSPGFGYPVTFPAGSVMIRVSREDEASQLGAFNAREVVANLGKR